LDYVLFPPEIVKVPLATMFLKSKKIIFRLTPQKIGDRFLLRVLVHELIMNWSSVHELVISSRTDHELDHEIIRNF
jgi:hypothetical protein